MGNYMHGHLERREGRRWRLLDTGAEGLPDIFDGQDYEGFCLLAGVREEQVNERRQDKVVPMFSVEREPHLRGLPPDGIVGEDALLEEDWGAHWATLSEVLSHLKAHPFRERDGGVVSKLRAIAETQDPERVRLVVWFD